MTFPVESGIQWMLIMGAQTPTRLETKDDPAWWEAPWTFLVHTVIGMVIFATIAGAAILLELGVDKLVPKRTSGVIVYGLKVAEYSVFGADLILFLVFLWRTSRRTIPKL
jgi:hypothetical protein